MNLVDNDFRYVSPLKEAACFRSRSQEEYQNCLVRNYADAPNVNA